MTQKQVLATFKSQQNDSVKSRSHKSKLFRFCCEWIEQAAGGSTWSSCDDVSEFLQFLCAEIKFSWAKQCFVGQTTMLDDKNSSCHQKDSASLRNSHQHFNVISSCQEVHVAAPKMMHQRFIKADLLFEQSCCPTGSLLSHVGQSDDRRVGWVCFSSCCDLMFFCKKWPSQKSLTPLPTHKRTTVVPLPASKLTSLPWPIDDDANGSCSTNWPRNETLLAADAQSRWMTVGQNLSKRLLFWLCGTHVDSSINWPVKLTEWHRDQFAFSQNGLNDHGAS